MSSARTIALAGDTMLGRAVAEAIAARGADSLVSPELAAITRDADLFVLNLECCISRRGEPWPDPRKPFYFRAPPEATELLRGLGVDCVTLANNHALDYGHEALCDTLEHLEAAGIAHVGAGRDLAEARSATILDADGVTLAVVACSDHPVEYAATPAGPGIAYADLREGLPDWLVARVGEAEADLVLVTPHWGPNMTSEPPGYVRRAADALQEVGAGLIAGHSSHVFHGIAPNVLYDLGDFLDDYAVDEALRNDLGLLFLVHVVGAVPSALEAVPLKLEHCHTRLAGGGDADWIKSRFRAACGALGTDVQESNGRLVVEWEARDPADGRGSGLSSRLRPRLPPCGRRDRSRPG